MIRYFLKVKVALLGLSVQKVSIGRQFKLKKGSKLGFSGAASFGDYVTITARGGEIYFGSNFHSNQNVIFNADLGGRLTFGDNCLVGPMCVFRTSNHNFEDPAKIIQLQGHTSADITIGDDVWLGAQVIVLPGVKIGNSVVVGAGSVVTKDLPDFSIAVGVPARVIKKRN